MNLAVHSVGRGRGWQRLPSILVRSFVVPTHVPKSVKDTSVTAHCHAAAAALTREYQSDHRRHVLIPATTHAVHLHPQSTTLTNPSISGARSEAEQRLAAGGRRCTPRSEAERGLPRPEVVRN